MANWFFLDACGSQHCIYLDMSHVSQRGFNNLSISCQMKMRFKHGQGVSMIWQNYPGFYE